MVRVYFQIRTGDQVINDVEGAEFDDVAGAKEEAELSLQEMLREDIKSETPLVPRTITILDENGNELATVQLKAVKMVQ